MLRDLIIKPFTIKGEYVGNKLHQTPKFKLQRSNISLSNEMYPPIEFGNNTLLHLGNASMFCRNAPTENI